MPKINFIIPVFIIPTILIFILNYFLEKLIGNSFKKTQKLYFCAIFGPFCPDVGKNEFSWKKGLISF